MALVSEVLNAGVPHSHWGLVKKLAAEQDLGYGKGGRTVLVGLHWTMIWEVAHPGSFRLSRCWYLKE